MQRQKEGGSKNPRASTAALEPEDSGCQGNNCRMLLLHQRRELIHPASGTQTLS